MYDEWRFATACLESVELGDRLLGAGQSALLSSELRVTHLKEWGLASVCREVWGRSRLLARSLGYSRMRAVAPSEVVYTLSRGLVPAIALLGTFVLAAAFVPPRHLGAEAIVAFFVLLATSLPVHRFYARRRGLGFAILAAPIQIVVQAVAAAALCTGWALRYLIGDVSPDATTQAYSEVGLEIWPPVPRRSR